MNEEDRNVISVQSRSERVFGPDKAGLFASLIFWFSLEENETAARLVCMSTLCAVY